MERFRVEVGDVGCAFRGLPDLPGDEAKAGDASTDVAWASRWVEEITVSPEEGRSGERSLLLVSAISCGDENFLASILVEFFIRRMELSDSWNKFRDIFLSCKPVVVHPLTTIMCAQCTYKSILHNSLACSLVRNRHLIATGLPSIAINIRTTWRNSQYLLVVISRKVNRNDRAGYWWNQHHEAREGVVHQVER